MKKFITTSFILGTLILNGSIANADSDALKDTEGNPLKENKEYYLHMIDNGTTGYYPQYHTSMSGWQYGYTNWLNNKPNQNNIVKLKALDLSPDQTNTDDSIYLNQRFSIEVPYGVDTNNYRYWTINNITAINSEETSENNYLYLDASEKKSWFKLSRFDREIYHDNRYTLGVISLPHYFTIGRQDTNELNLIGQGIDTIRVLNNTDLKTKVEFIPVKEK